MDSLLFQIFNLQRLAVLTTALAQSPPDPELIYEAMKDRVHQPYRKPLVRYYHTAVTPIDDRNRFQVLWKSLPR